MDINQLCPGCMRELPGAEHGKSGANERGRQKAGKCPRCGFDAAAYRQNSRCLPLYTILAGKYLVGAVLGEGGFGITYMGYDLNMETRIAIKEYFPVELVSRDTTSMTGDRVISLSGDKSVTYKQGLKKYVTEAQNVSRFSETPGVVSVKDFFYENETAYIVMEYIEGQSLKDYLKERGGRLSEEEALDIMKPVLEALVKVHEAGIIHRDISPDNIMLTFGDGGDGGEYSGAAGPKAEYKAVPEQAFAAIGNRESGMRAAADRSSTGGRAGEAGRIHTGNGAGTETMAADRGRQIDNSRHVTSVKLIDFGAARMTEKNDQKSLTIILKHGYAPEEQYRTHGEQGPWTDVYALCAVFYRMLTGQTPVPAMDRLFRDDLKSLEELNANVTKSTQAAILKGLAVKREDRIRTVTELMQALYERKAIKNHSGRKLFWAAGICSGCLLLAAAAGAIILWSHPQEQSKGNIPEINPAENGSEPEAIAPEIGATVEFEAEELGETVAFPDSQTSLSIGGNHALFVMPDGTVKARGANAYGQCMVKDWRDIVAVSAGPWHSLGLRSDGKVFAAGRNGNGECDVDTWENVVSIAAGGNDVSYGLTAEGKVLACGMNTGDHFSHAAEWEDIVAITSTDWGGVIGLDREGTVHYAGSAEGVDEDGSLRPFRFEEEYLPVSGWMGVKHLFLFSQDTLLGLKEDGSLMSAYITENAVPHDTLLSVEAWQEIGQLDVGWPVMGVKRDGTMVFGNDSDVIDMQGALSEWDQVQAVGVMGGMAIGLGKDGTILEYRQNVGNADIETMDNLEWIHVLESSDGDNLVAMDRENRILTHGGGGIYLNPLETLNTAEEMSARMIADFVGEDAVVLKDGRVCFYRDWAGGGAWMGDAEPYAGEHVMQALELQRRYQRHLYAFLLEDGHVEICLAGPDLENGALAEEMERQRQSVTGAESWEEVVQIAGSAQNGLYGLHRDGTVSLARAGGTKKLENCQGITGLAGRGGDILGVREDGTVEVIAAGEYAVMFGRTQVSAWTGIQDISMGESHVAGLREDGTVIAAGSNHEGQCDVEDWTDVIYMTTGRNCTLGITSAGQLKMAGELY